MCYSITTIYYKSEKPINKRSFNFIVIVVTYINLYVTVIHSSFKNLVHILKLDTMSVIQKLNAKLFSHI